MCRLAAASSLTLALDLLEQLGVLDRQHRLVGQRLDEIHRLRSESSRRFPAEHERTDQAVLAQQRHGEQGAIAGLSHHVVEGVLRLVVDVRDLHRRAPQAGQARHAFPKPYGLAGQPFDHVLVQLVRCLDVEQLGVLVIGVEYPGVGLAEGYGMSSDRLENRAQLQGRVHGLAHLSERLQLAHRARQLARPRLHLIEQPRVLDGDRRLVGEGRHELDLLIGEGPHIRAGQGHDTDRNDLPQYRDPERCAKAAKLLGFCEGVFRIGFDIGDLDDLSFQQGSPRYRASLGLYRDGPDQFHEFRRETVRLGPVESIADLAGDRGLIRVAEPRRRLDQRV